MVENIISVVVPAYNEEQNIYRAADTISQILTEEQIEYEIVFVSDGSKDGTWERICASSGRNPRVRGVRFSRNFGKEAAIFAGLAEAKGACCAVIDCDLQHPPEKLVDMYRLWEQGYEVIEGVKTDRGEESFAHSLGAKCFYALLSRAADIDMSKASDFKLLDRRAVDVLLTMREKHTFFRALSSWIGFRTAEVEFDVTERQEGSSKWSRWSLIRYAVQNLASFSSFPLHFITFAGVLVLILSVVLGGIALYQKVTNVAQEGFTTVIVVLLFIGSVIMISLGCIGYYIAKIYEEIQDRPRYIIAERCGLEE